MKQQKKYSWFFKFLLSYLLILLIPLVALNGVIGQRINKVYQDEIYATVEGDLHAMAQKMDHELENVLRSSYQISLLTDVQQFDFQNDPLAANNIKQVLSAYRNTHGFAEDIVLYLPTERYLISSSSTYPNTLFFQQVYKNPALGAEGLENLLNTLEEFTVLPGTLGPAGEGLLLLTPMHSRTATRVGTSLFFIPNRSLEELLVQQMGYYQAEVVIRKGQDVLYASSPLLSKQSAELPATIEKPFYLARDEENYLVHRMVSPTAGWEYTLYIPDNQPITQKLGALTKTMQTATLLVALLAGVVIFVLMRVNYSPLRRLRNKALSLSPSGPERFNELETIGSTLELLSKENKALAARLETAIFSAHNIRLQQLLTGRYASREEFLDSGGSGEAMEIALPYDTFVVACVSWQQQYLDIEELAHTLRRFLPWELTAHYVFTPEAGRLYFINVIPLEQEQALYSLYDTARQQTEEELAMSLTIGLGSSAQGAADIPKSFLQAGAAVDYRFIKGNSSTISYSEILPANTNDLYPYGLLEKLRNAITAADPYSVEQYISKIIQHIIENNLPLFMAKNICFEILHLVLWDGKSLQVEYNTQEMLLVLNNAASVYDVVDLIRELYGAIELVQDDKETQDTNTLLKNIKEYLEQQALDCDFSVQGAADHFQMLLPNFSQFFKDQTGQSVLDYTTELRMEKAKKLLETTELPLKELSYQVGYYNVSSFIRRFKQTQGITPGNYRQAVKENLQQ